jgi:RNA polymerase sigma factor (sigma-70 family)
MIMVTESSAETVSMGTPRRRYPPEFRNVLRHASRFSELLTRLEQNQTAGTWVIGRAAELRAVVSCATSDWRSGAVAETAALGAITSYVDGLHRDAAKQLGCRPQLECCTIEDAITFDMDEDATKSVASQLGAQHSEAATERAGWMDDLEVLDRFNSELARVDVHARALARRLGTRAVTIDDLCGFGREGLLDAARSYDERHATPFSHWATLRIRRAMIDGVRQWGGLPRRVLRELKEIDASEAARCASDNDERSQNGFVTPCDSASSLWRRTASAEVARGATSAGLAELNEFAASPEELVANAEMRDALRESMARLPDRERNVVEGYCAGRKLKELGAMAGATECWTSRILARALAAIRRDLQSMKPA